MRRAFASLLLIVFLVARGSAQQGSAGGMQMGGMDHMAGMAHDGQPGMASQSGQAAFAAISEVVKLLKADPKTDWSKVNLEALRQHLIDMDNVTMRSQVKQSSVSGGLVMNITGTTAPVVAAIQRMVGMHAMMLSEGEGETEGMAAKAVKIPGGMRLTVTARDTADAQLVARIRGLGFIGMMTEGEHHPMHHMMVARGGSMMGH